MITPPWVTQAASVTSIRIIYSNSLSRVSAQRAWNCSVGSAPSGTKPEPGVIHFLKSSSLTRSFTGRFSNTPKPASRRSCTVNWWPALGNRMFAVSTARTSGEENTVSTCGYSNRSFSSFSWARPSSHRGMSVPLPMYRPCRLPAVMPWRMR